MVKTRLLEHPWSRDEKLMAATSETGFPHLQVMGKKVSRNSPVLTLLSKSDVTLTKIMSHKIRHDTWH
jgi:hypothetical protein